ncbi:MAG: 3-phosphoserine/phosphohydroxythreonine transaminase [Ruthenibacterium sp.]
MARVYNFSAGPSMLPLSVLQTAQSELLEYGSSGQSVMEMSHRSSVYDAIIKETQSALRRVMNIPDNYKVGFIQGGASMQFAMVPMNLMTTGEADYLVTGQFSGKAQKEAAKFGTAHIVASGKENNFTRIPDVDAISYNKNASYLHICENNTIFGTRYTKLPQVPGVPLVADMSSCILSRPTDVSKYGLIYFGVQKNVAPAGMAVVILREDLMENARTDIARPDMLDYKTLIEADSMYNTPPCYTIYMMGLVLKWIENEVGGLAEMEKRNNAKAALLYDYLDASAFFQNPVNKPDRSIMNVTFTSPNAELDKKFCAESTAAGFVNLKGHRSVGGMRASIYNAMPAEGVASLVEFMRKFEKENA